MDKLKELFRFLITSSKRIVVFVVGVALVLAGLAMFVLPGPGILVVIAGLAVLATEFAWAAVLLERAKTEASKAGNAAKNRFRRKQAE